MKNEEKRLQLTSLAALLVFAVFALCALLVLLTGAKVYRQLTDRAAQRFDAATAARYLTTRVHQADRAAGLSIEPFGSAEALVLHSEVDGEAFETRVYCHDGWLCELYSPQNSDLAPEDGEQILPMDALSFSLNGQVLSISIPDANGRAQTLTFVLRAQQEAAP